MNLSPPIRNSIGCIPLSKVNEIKNKDGYFTPIAGQFDENQCLQRAAALGALCNNDSSQPCQYIGRSSALNSEDVGECWIIGHGKKPLEFNQMLYRNVSDCPTSGDLTKSLRVTALNTNQYQEGQKKVAQQELDALNKDIQDKKQRISKTQLYIKCMQQGRDYQTCLQEEAKNNLALMEEEQQRDVLKIGQNYRRVRTDQEKGQSLLNQFDKRWNEMKNNLKQSDGELGKYQENINLKTKLINHNNEIYHQNIDTAHYLKFIIFILVFLAFSYLIYINFTHIMNSVRNVGTQINNLGNTLGNFGTGITDNFSDLKLRNLQNFSF
jgi:hypothetical protein